MKSVFLDFGTLSRDDIDVSPLLDVLPETEFFVTTAAGDIVSRVRDAQVVILNKVRLSRRVIEAAAHLRLVCVAATGTDNIDLAAARDHGVAVCNIRAYCTASVVQHVFAMILGLTHHLSRYSALVKEGAWQASDQFCLLDYPVRELAGRTMGIVGFGELGRAVARVAEAFGMTVLLTARAGENRPGRLPLAELLPRVDVLSLHCPLTPETTGLIGAAELAAMKDDAVLINTARGGLVDSRALVEALRSETLGGAGIDVLSEEPPVGGDPLLEDDTPNLIVTPHIAWSAREARQRALNEIATNVRDFKAGGMRNRVQ